jgi:hypothetical protein
MKSEYKIDGMIFKTFRCFKNIEKAKELSKIVRRGESLSRVKKTTIDGKTHYCVLLKRKKGYSNVEMKDAMKYHNSLIDQLKIPKTLYHVTDRKNLESIKKNGIVLGRKRTGKFGKIRGVYLTDVPEEITKWDFDVGDPIIIKVNPKGLKFKLDPDFYPDWLEIKYDTFSMNLIENINFDYEGMYLYTKNDIPANRIVGWREFQRCGSKWV